MDKEIKELLESAKLKEKAASKNYKKAVEVDDHMRASIFGIELLIHGLYVEELQEILNKG